MSTTPAPQTMTPAEIHDDAVAYLVAVRRAQARLTARMATETGAERRLTTECLAVLETRHTAALADMHAAADALHAARPACCQDTPVPHEPSIFCQSGRRTGRKHCSCDRCF